MEIRWLRTSTLSAKSKWVLTHLAIILRFALTLLSRMVRRLWSARLTILTRCSEALTTSLMGSSASSDSLSMCCHSSSVIRTRSIRFLLAIPQYYQIYGITTRLPIVATQLGLAQGDFVSLRTLSAALASLDCLLPHTWEIRSLRSPSFPGVGQLHLPLIDIARSAERPCV